MTIIKQQNNAITQKVNNGVKSKSEPIKNNKKVANKQNAKVLYEAKKWTLEQRLQQAQRIRQQKSWKHSTGPRTVNGKEKVSKNSYKHGGRCAEVRELAQNITEYKRQLNKLIEFIK